jgi:hypothetical protein
MIRGAGKVTAGLLPPPPPTLSVVTLGLIEVVGMMAEPPGLGGGRLGGADMESEVARCVFRAEGYLGMFPLLVP